MAVDEQDTMRDTGGWPTGGKRSKVVRDAVTGEPLTDEHGRRLPTCGPYFIRVQSDLSDPVPSAEAIEETLPRRVPLARTLPTAIDTNQPYPQGRLGGKAWTPEWKRYIGRQTVSALQAERDAADDAADDEYRYWWRTPYGARRIRDGFTRRYGAERGAHVADLVLALLDAPDRIGDLAREAGRSANWLDRQRTLAYRFGLTRYRAPSRTDTQ